MTSSYSLYTVIIILKHCIITSTIVTVKPDVLATFLAGKLATMDTDVTRKSSYEVDLLLAVNPSVGIYMT